jgi:hypothetical protein
VTSQRLFPEILRGLASLFDSPKSEVVDNAISAVFRIWSISPQSVDLAAVMPVVIRNLPVKVR